MDDKLIIKNRDGSETVVENPFEAMKATYEVLKNNPNAIPELSDESRKAILEEIDLEDYRYYADRHRGKHKTSGPHWSLVFRYVKLFDVYEKLLTEYKVLCSKVRKGK